ncbi:hypothetical protein EV715DRAFT_268164 [Schizophyllum commune]
MERMKGATAWKDEERASRVNEYLRALGGPGSGIEGGEQTEAGQHDQATYLPSVNAPVPLIARTSLRRTRAASLEWTVPSPYTSSKQGGSLARLGIDVADIENLHSATKAARKNRSKEPSKPIPVPTCQIVPGRGSCRCAGLNTGASACLWDYRHRDADDEISRLMDDIASTGECKEQQQAEERGQNEAPAARVRDVLQMDVSRACVALGEGLTEVMRAAREEQAGTRSVLGGGGGRGMKMSASIERRRAGTRTSLREHRETTKVPHSMATVRPTIQPSIEPTETFQKRLPQTRPGLPVASRRAADPTRRPGLQAKRAPVCQQ